ncbi:mitochondrial folate transporter/carrier [Piromyces finnis]|uniref:Mitochondrial folate transporter/carrier n=1 Tax=Piromyces finnis TaxID=1754191 RepID=A0A1Y1VC64_9FUNG|nr:mitochondrial folate transporter/carrier [Piromyces finnis]|eukprot:ORX52260.1 mitochondrial folate transporter/carrier [Piromyces finnis]
MTGSKSLDEAIAGIGAGMVSTLTLHPLETVKTRLQVHDGRIIALKHNGTFKTMIDIIKSDGYKGLYQGLSPNLIGNTVSWGIYFWIYSMKKDQYSKQNNGERLTKTQHMRASYQAGLITQVTTTPIWLIKTRMCIQTPSDPERYKSIIDAARKIYKYEGIKGFYKGMVSTLVGTSHGAIQFMAYEEMKIIYKNRYPEKDNSDALSYIVMAASSKVFATLITYPYQVIRARLQVIIILNNEFYNGCIDAIKKIYIREGVSGYYKGMFTNIFRVLPNTCVTFLVYETLSRCFSKKNKKETNNDIN